MKTSPFPWPSISAKSQYTRVRTVASLKIRLCVTLFLLACCCLRAANVPVTIGAEICGGAPFYVIGPGGRYDGVAFDCDHYWNMGITSSVYGGGSYSYTVTCPDWFLFATDFLFYQ